MDMHPVKPLSKLIWLRKKKNKKTNNQTLCLLKSLAVSWLMQTPVLLTLTEASTAPHSRGWVILCPWLAYVKSKAGPPQGCPSCTNHREPACCKHGVTVEVFCKEVRENVVVYIWNLNLNTCLSILHITAKTIQYINRHAAFARECCDREKQEPKCNQILQRGPPSLMC